MWDIQHQSTQWTSGPYQDVVHYSWMGYPSFLKSLSFCDFSSNLTVPDIQNSSLFGISRNGISLDQERFKSTLPMSLPVDHHMTNLGSSMNGFQWVCLIFRQTWQVWTYSFWILIEHVRYPEPINSMNVRTLSRWCLLLLNGISMVCKMFDIFLFFVEFDMSGHAKFFTFWETTELEIYQSGTL